MNARSYAASRTPSRTSSVGPAFLKTLSAASGAMTALVRALLNRRVAGTLEQLSDHHLADIGLTRSDVRQSLAMPLSVDPTVEFARRARLNTYR